MSNYLIALAIIIIGFVLNLTCLFSPYWKRNDSEDRVIETIYQHSGIWISCTRHSFGNYDCDDFDRYILGLPLEIQLGRIVGVLGGVLGLVGIITYLSAGEWSTSVSEHSKTRMKLTCGILTFLAGLCILIVTGYYANVVLKYYWEATDAFNRRRNTSIQREVFGWSLFVGWAGGAIEVIVGIVVAIMSCLSKGESGQAGFNYNGQGARNYAYRADQPAPLYGKEYV